MAPVLLIGRLPAANKASRDKLIAGLGKIADYAKENDPETTKHATHISADPSDETTVWAIEEYTSQEACNKHMSWGPVAEFLKMVGADPGIFGEAPEIWHSHQQLYFTRPELATVTRPLILLAKVTYKPDKFAEALEGWAPVVKSTKAKESGVLTYSVGKDVEVENRLTFVEIYENKEYLSEVHMKGPALQQKIKDEEGLRTVNPDIVFLKHVAGYWYKNPVSVAHKL